MITKITIKINHDHVKQKTLVPITQKPLNLRLVIIHKSKSIETYIKFVRRRACC